MKSDTPLLLKNQGFPFRHYITVPPSRLFERIAARGWQEGEWERLKDDLDDLEEITVRNGQQTFVIRSQTVGDAGKAIRAAGVALGPLVRLSNQ